MRASMLVGVVQRHPTHRSSLRPDESPRRTGQCSEQHVIAEVAINPRRSLMLPPSTLGPWFVIIGFSRRCACSQHEFAPSRNFKTHSRECHGDGSNFAEARGCSANLPHQGVEHTPGASNLPNSPPLRSPRLPRTRGRDADWTSGTNGIRSKRTASTRIRVAHGAPSVLFGRGTSTNQVAKTHSRCQACMPVLSLHFPSGRRVPVRTVCAPKAQERRRHRLRSCTGQHSAPTHPPRLHRTLLQDRCLVARPGSGQL